MGLDRTRAKVFVGQGSADQAVSRWSFDALYAHLRAQGRDVTGVLVPGADHSFAVTGPDGKPRSGWKDIHEQVLDWFEETRHGAANGRPRAPSDGD